MLCFLLYLGVEVVSAEPLYHMVAHVSLCDGVGKVGAFAE